MGKLISFPVEKIRNPTKEVDDVNTRETCKLYLFTGVRYERHVENPLPPHTANTSRLGAKGKQRQR